MYASQGISPPDNYTISTPEIDMVDGDFIVFRVYSTYLEGFNYFYYDRKQKQDFNMIEATNNLANFNTILDYKTGNHRK